MNDDFGDRMKMLERVEAGRRLMPLVPICARMDGKGFSKYTENLKRPFDARLSVCMIETTKKLVEMTDARIGYTQSDEISLIYHSDRYETQVFFDGKLQKINSVLASIVTAIFNPMAKDLLGEDVPDIALFDCRVWSVPTTWEAVNAILWREQDATKNSISMAARHYYDHKDLHRKTGKEMQEMLFQKGINWNDYPSFFKRGTYVQRRTHKRPFTPDELNRIPERRRPPADAMVERSEVVQLDMPPLVRVENREAVVFECAEPVLKKDIS